MFKTYRERREELVRILGGGTIALKQSEEVEMTPENPYKYRHDANFYYYTGIDTPDAAIIISGGQGKPTVTTLFVNPPDPKKEIWTGPMPTLEKIGAGFDEVLPFCEFPGENANTHTREEKEKAFDSQRLIKSPEEIKIIKAGCAASAGAFREIMMSWCDMRDKGTLSTEFALDGYFTYQFCKRGSNRLSYPNIVASGTNAIVLHYEKNNCEIKDGSLVLVDAGGEYGGYATDITRTWPASGKFSSAQLAIYNIVKETQRWCIEMVKPGVLFGEIQEKAVQMINDGAVSLGLPEYRYFPHSIGHWLGMDVHDCVSIERWGTTLQPGMILTIEPGFYVPDNDDMGEYRGIGVRLEDDILVTQDGHHNLTGHAPLWDEIST